ncbi:hypothetical protein [Leisingera caerulea]|uniref:hypothetical protein n=1 Tax=Leisingera caerulea TaxID=506591 RepID=UPI0021A68A16|nr:hypothetical protein [Leisingera caerulea]UWQ82615.1 hypothetical protein K3726_13065 [Leisingera caerulea]
MLYLARRAIWPALSFWLARRLMSLLSFMNGALIGRNAEFSALLPGNLADQLALKKTEGSGGFQDACK